MTEGLVARQREEIEMKDVKVEQLESKVTGLGSSLKLAQERVQRYVKALGRRLPDPKPGDKPKKATVKAKVKAVKKATKKTKKR
jgi:hypothetical protein